MAQLGYVATSGVASGIRAKGDIALISLMI
jgi:hypothetical protein